MRHLFSGLALLLALAAFSGRAHAQQTLVLTTVDDVSRDATSNDATLEVAGIVSGESTPRTISAHLYVQSRGMLPQLLESCERYALLMMSKPGRYLLELTTPGSTAQYTVVSNCRLKRAP